MDLTDNIKVFMTNCKSSVGVSISMSPSLDDQVNKEKVELANMLGKLQEAIKRKNMAIKDD